MFISLKAKQNEETKTIILNWNCYLIVNDGIDESTDFFTSHNKIII